MSSTQWSPYNQYVWLITTERGWYQVNKQYRDESGQMTWAIRVCSLDSFGKPVNVWPKPTGMYIGGYTAGMNEDGEYLPDHAYVDATIEAYESSVPPTPVIESTDLPLVGPESVQNINGAGI